MSAPAFGDLAAVHRGGSPSHRCLAAIGFACLEPGPHLPPAEPDPATLPAFPDLEPTPSLWSTPTHPGPCQPGSGSADRDECLSHGRPVAECEPAPYRHARSTNGPGRLHSRPAPGPLCPECVAEDAATIAQAAPGPRTPAQERPDLMPEDDGTELPCGRRYSDTQDGPLRSCTLYEDHPGKHETHARRPRP